MLLVWILVAAVVAFCSYGIWYMGRLLKQKGVDTLATITRISGIGVDGDYFTVRLAWTQANGVEREGQKDVYCDLGDLPREGDKIEIRYVPDDDQNFFEITHTPVILRHDQLVSR